MRVIWMIYLILGVVLTLLAFASSGNPRVGMAEGVCATIVNVGLVLLIVQASTGLAEERTRGNLDILLTTPISTFDVLTGKWLGAYRIVPVLMFFPAVITFTIAWESGRGFDWCLYVILLHAYGATTTSMGLALATWIPNLGRAIAASVASFVLFNAGVIAALAYFATGKRDETALLVSIAGTLYGSIFGAVNVGSLRQLPGGAQDELRTWIIIWNLGHYALAIALFLTTWATFGRCLGRIPTRRIRPWGSSRGDIGVGEGRDKLVGGLLRSVDAVGNPDAVVGDSG